jgi:short-subunit dehydrogenase
MGQSSIGGSNAAAAPLAVQRARVAVVTGASSGIGRATARLLGAGGMTVVLAARRADELERLAGEIERDGGKAVAVSTDVSLLTDIERLVERAMAIDGVIDALVNVAGVGLGNSIMIRDDLAQRLLAVNLLAPARLMKAVIPILRAQRHGSIVNIGSVAGEIATSGLYSATKFGLRGLTDSVRRELAGSGIGVTLIEPGYVATPLTAYRRQRMPGPEIVARAVVSALRRPRRKIVVPAYYRLAMLFGSLFPGILDRFLAGKAAAPVARRSRGG